MKNTITPKQTKILLLIYRFRFLSRYHIQTLLNHKDPKTINTWLKDLTNKKILGRHYSSKLKENTQPAIYYLASGSRKYLEELEEVDTKTLSQRMYREKTRSQRFIYHHLLLADFYLQLLAETEEEKLRFFTKTDLATHYYLPYNRPDAYIAKVKDKTTKRYFLEIIDSGTPRFILRKLVEKYIEYYDSNSWQETTNHPFPTMLLLCPDEEIKAFLCKHISQVMEEEVEAEIDWYLSTKENISWENALDEIED